MSRNRVDVVHNKRADRWQAEHAGVVLSQHHTKAAAVEAGRAVAKAAFPNGQLVIHKMNGRIQEERTYGNDPFPPRG